MNLLFLTLLDFDSIEERNIYTDLLREFYRNGHKICIVSPVERRKHSKVRKIIIDDRLSIIKPKIGNTQKTNVIEKGISTLTLESKILEAIKKYYSDIKFDLVLYSTPPITLQKAVEYVKKRDNATTYLMLKDIFPQNAVDLGMLATTGLKRMLYQYFRKKEKKLYQISDYIGCMSQANVDYILKHNPEISDEKVEICPNAIEVTDIEMSQEEKEKMRKKYGIPLDKKVFVYGGNLGKPQGIDFMIECLKSQKNNLEVFFLIVGSGTEYGKIEKFILEDKQKNVKLMKQMPKDDYDRMIASCDVGMVFLDHRFTIPNFPSRLLSYMQTKLPVLAVTDVNTDLGKVILEGEFGWWCESNQLQSFQKKIIEVNNSDLELLGENAFRRLNDTYNIKICIKIILNSIEKYS